MAKTTIYVLNGPNMNLLGTREPEKYGRATLADVEKLCAETAKRFGIDSRLPSIEQGRRTGRLDSGGAFQESCGRSSSTRPATRRHRLPSWTHCWRCRRQCPSIEIHITNIHQREAFRHNSYISKAAKAVIAGFGVDGYALAITGLAGLVGAKQKR